MCYFTWHINNIAYRCTFPSNIITSISFIKIVIPIFSRHRSLSRLFTLSRPLTSSLIRRILRILIGIHIHILICIARWWFCRWHFFPFWRTVYTCNIAFAFWHNFFFLCFCRIGFICGCIRCQKYSAYKCRSCSYILHCIIGFRIQIPNAILANNG